MISKLTTGKSFYGAVHYNEKKVKKGTADYLGAENYLIDSPKSLRDKVNYLEVVSSLNQRSKTNCFHFVAAFSPDDVIEDDTMRTIARQFMQDIGFGQQPFLVYRHHDTKHPHLHIVTSNIQLDGKRINDKRLGATKMFQANR